MKTQGLGDSPAMTTLSLLAQKPRADDFLEARADLAAAFRWFARLGMNEAVANHLSFAVSDDGARFLVNPRGRHFANVRAGDLLLLDAHDTTTLDRPDAPDPTAWHLHARLHALVPAARCVMHLHSTYATALACLADSTMPPIDMNTARFYGRVAIDDAFNGMALTDAEGDRVAKLLGPDKSVLLMANHGVLVIGPTVAAAFDLLYYFERAAQTLLTCYGTGRPLRIMPDAVARATEAEWQQFEQSANDHLANIRSILDRDEPDYRL